MNTDYQQAVARYLEATTALHSASVAHLSAVMYGALDAQRPVHNRGSSTEVALANATVVHGLARATFEAMLDGAA